ncbi:MAG: hypothetical protein ACK4UN_03120 [Limisphaerales bacterium]
MSPLAAQLAEAVGLFETETKGMGLARAERMSAKVGPLLQWIHWYRSHFQSSSALDLLSGTRASALEAMAYVSVGLGRAALMAIRTQIDLMLSFTYFKDHPVEWERVRTTGEGFMLRGDIYSYHKTSDKGFLSRLAMIESKAQVSLEDLYKTLSAHIHGQSPFTVPDSKRSPT